MGVPCQRWRCGIEVLFLLFVFVVDSQPLAIFNIFFLEDVFEIFILPGLSCSSLPDVIST